MTEIISASRFIALRQTGREFLRLALVALAYWLAAKLSLNLALVHGQVTPIWPPTGIRPATPGSRDIRRRSTTWPI